jgi:osmotically inducible protein OsmC
MKQTGSAIWRGDLKSGIGALSTHSGALHETPYGFAMRFEGAKGTNPEELIAAAHAGCFTMALTANLGKAGFTPKRLATSATVTLEQVAGNWTITTVHLENEAWVPGLTAEKFQQIADDTKVNCPVSRVLRAQISLHAKLESSAAA